MTEQSDIVGRLRDAACQGACRWEIMGDPPRRVDVPIGDLLADAATEIERLRAVALSARRMADLYADELALIEAGEETASGMRNPEQAMTLAWVDMHRSLARRMCGETRP